MEWVFLVSAVFYGRWRGKGQDEESQFLFVHLSFSLPFFFYFFSLSLSLSSVLVGPSDNKWPSLSKQLDRFRRPRSHCSARQQRHQPRKAHKKKLHHRIRKQRRRRKRCTEAASSESILLRFGLGFNYNQLGDGRGKAKPSCISLFFIVSSFYFAATYYDIVRIWCSTLDLYTLEPRPMQHP